MCGIIGILGKSDVAPLIVEGLKRLEYRGYDSSGVATIDHGRLDRRRASGKLNVLAERLDKAPLAGATGIGHTRWATHGGPTDENAHPHLGDDGKLALIHNGARLRQDDGRRHGRRPRRFRGEFPLGSA